MMVVGRRLAGAGIALFMLLGMAGPAAAEDPVVPPAPAPVVTPTIGTLPAAVTYLARRDRVRATVQYRCVNTDTMVTYLHLSFTQARSAGYQNGMRGDLGRLLVAQCTGELVTQRFGLVRSSYALPTHGRPTSGRARLSVSMSQRSIPELGGWYVLTGPGADRAAAVRVRRR